MKLFEPYSIVCNAVQWRSYSEGEGGKHDPGNWTGAAITMLQSRTSFSEVWICSSKEHDQCLYHQKSLWKKIK